MTNDLKPDVSPKVAVIDYGAGNLASVVKALEAVGAVVETVASSKDIIAAERLVFPGVGAFNDAIDVLKQKGLVEGIRESVARGTPFLGICLGMQMLFEKSYEHGEHEGLGLIKGAVRPFNARAVRTPLTGWNTVDQHEEMTLFKGIPSNSYFYFNHGYFCKPKAKNIHTAQTDHGGMFACAVQLGRLYGVQFHPEKSQVAGLVLLRNFLVHG